MKSKDSSSTEELLLQRDFSPKASSNLTHLLLRVLRYEALGAKLKAVIKFLGQTLHPFDIIEISLYGHYTAYSYIFTSSMNFKNLS